MLAMCMFGTASVYLGIQPYIHTYTTEMYTTGLCTLFCRECFERERMLKQKTEHLLQLYDPPFLCAEVKHNRGGRGSFHSVSLSQRERVCALPKKIFLSSCLLLDYFILASTVGPT